MTTLRFATESDVPVILRFIRGLAEYERLAHEMTATEEKVRESFLAQRGLWLEDLFVLPEYRSRGIGRILLTHLAQLAVERKCGRLEWWVLDWNEAAIRFYESLGAVPLSDWTVYRVTGPALTQLAGVRIEEG